MLDNIICYYSIVYYTKLCALHPARNARFGSFRTQPLEILSAASVRISLKRNLTLGTDLG